MKGKWPPAGNGSVLATLKQCQMTQDYRNF